MNRLGRRVVATLVLAAAASAAAGVLDFTKAAPLLVFIASTIGLATLASLVGEATEQLGDRLGPNATGILQSFLGNLPELFIGIFALRAGLVVVVQAALVGSVLGNSLLVLGVAFVVGGLRHGTQAFRSEPPRLIALITVLAVSAVMMPTLASQLHTPAAGHEKELGLAVAVVLLVVFAATVVYSLRSPAGQPRDTDETERKTWSVTLAAVILGAAAVAAAFVADWFVGSLQPAMNLLHISPGFAGLVIVALAGNAVENVVGIRLAAQNQPDLAVSVILNSSLQVAVGLIPALVLLSAVVGGVQLTLVLPPLLVAALALTAILSALIVYDGESTWVEGLALVGLYAIVAAAFWWG